jgi:hypothetical protein
MSNLDFTRLREALAYDPETGVFTWRIRASKNTHIGEIAGCPRPKMGYIRISLDGGMYYAHRLAWGYVYGVWPAGQIDHINGVRTDNRICNLRDVTSSVNNHNSTRKAANRAGYTGVRMTPKGRYVATICRRHIGVFDTPDQAHAAYLAAKRAHLPK